MPERPRPSPDRVDQIRLQRAHAELSADLARCCSRLVALDAPAWTAQTDAEGALLPQTLTHVVTPRQEAIAEEFHRISATMHALLDAWFLTDPP